MFIANRNNESIELIFFQLGAQGIKAGFVGGHLGLPFIWLCRPYKRGSLLMKALLPLIVAIAAISSPAFAQKDIMT
ncbi:hypothetical protein, partial [Sphingorhabdus sp.]|uniref:hypothetical protein n=1 Tax=Sphingorhabdus sp. TaxID=1902408 RepID=UPI0037C8B884